MKEKKVLIVGDDHLELGKQAAALLANSASANVSTGTPRPEKKAPLVFKYNSAAGPFRKGFTEPGRNAPCPCGSGKKFKHCHLDKMTETIRAGVVKASKKNQEERP